ncbi:deoxyguanosinetriphosphate triphosphohydrolase family protein [Paenibacillus macquariensis]|uniref:DGTPase n=1 Tax=Paenibacillus macquariensis TaxID=948756 RepID=A0ABY1K4P9_9BACL|nr:dNTP triphosphohydrolase [Paenibacillus macquariensis]MEC0089043.1 dNTP triphosphohydrolase [Paenibacillus macquariensis]SIR24993.1 dGTPase [Paenibacillus macquariensis]
MSFYNQETMDYVQESIPKLDKLNFRLHDMGDDERGREDYSRDYARVLYSASFRRLQGKMQLLGIDNNHFFRNRLTHSMEVAQIARGLAMDLKLDTFVVEACSLAHDLGNPPIGHYGERVLGELVQDIGSFEGNAQTLRILMKLEKKHYSYQGLNLTFRSLLGVVKYFNQYNSGENKKFIYDDNYLAIQEVLDRLKLTATDACTIDMQIMDLADEIAYAAHDLEDCLSQNLFSIDELLYEFKVHEAYRSVSSVLEGIIQHCTTFASQGTRLKSSEEYSFLFRKELTSKIVNTLIRDITYNETLGRLSFNQYGALSSGLKKMVFHMILRKPSVQMYEKKGEKVLRGLYTVYNDESFNKDLQLLPPEYRVIDENTDKRRNIIDFISGMMDSFAVQEYSKYYGENVSLYTIKHE